MTATDAADHCPVLPAGPEVISVPKGVRVKVVECAAQAQNGFDLWAIDERVTHSARYSNFHVDIGRAYR
jgi:hypothetical protein